MYWNSEHYLDIIESPKFSDYRVSRLDLLAVYPEILCLIITESSIISQLVFKNTLFKTYY